MLEEKLDMDYSKVNDGNYHGKNRVLGQGGCDFLTCCLATTFPCWVCCSCKTVSSISNFKTYIKFYFYFFSNQKKQVQPRQEMLVLQWQKPIELIAEAGIHCFVPFGKTFRYIETSINTVELTNKVIADKIGFDFQKKKKKFTKKSSKISF